MPSPSSFTRSSPSLFCGSNTAYEEVLNEHYIKEYSASEFKLLVTGDLSTNDFTVPGPKKLTLADFIIGELGHYKEARNYSKWEHEFIVAKMYHPNDSGSAGVLVIDREQRPGTPDIVRVIPGDNLHSIWTVLSRMGYRPSNLGRSCAFASPPSVGQIASVLAEKSQAGGEYSVHNHNCYWYAKAVFDHCSDTYGGSITHGPYCNDLGTFMNDTPETFVAQVRMDIVAGAVGIVASMALGSSTISSFPIGIYVIAMATYRSILGKKAKLSQAEPLWS